MKKMKWISAMLSATMAITCVSSVSASAFTKDDIIAVDEHSVTFNYYGSDYDMMTVADTEEGCKYICTKATNCCAVVMEEPSAVIDEDELYAIGETLTAIPAEDFEYNGRYAGEYGAMDLDDLDLSRTYIITCGELYDKSELYKITGVAEVYEMTGTAYTNGWIDAVNTNSGTYVLWAAVPAGTEFTVEDCAGLPYKVESVEYNRTYNELDSYYVVVQYDKDDTQYADPKYKSIFDMQLAMLDLMDGNISVTTPLIHLMNDTEGLYLLTPVEREADISYGDLNSDGKVGILDAIYISKANAQIITLNESQTKAADLNSDGTVDDADLNILLSYLVEQIDTLPVA